MSVTDMNLLKTFLVVLVKTEFIMASKVVAIRNKIRFQLTQLRIAVDYIHVCISLFVHLIMQPFKDLAI